MASPGNRHFANCSGILSFPMVRRKKILRVALHYTSDLPSPNLVLVTYAVARTSCSCNLSFMACFANINVSQSSVATYARCGEMFTIH